MSVRRTRSPAASSASASRPGPLPISSTRAPAPSAAANRSIDARTASGIAAVPAAYAAALPSYAATVIERGSWRDVVEVVDARRGGGSGRGVSTVNTLPSLRRPAPLPLRRRVTPSYVAATGSAAALTSSAPTAAGSCPA